MDIFEETRKLNFPLGEYVVIGSGPLAARGIRSARDIDILASKHLFNRLLTDGWQETTEPSSRRCLKKGLYEIHENLHAKNYTPDTQALIEQAEVLDGIPFLPLTELMHFKQAVGRDKDLRDVERMKTYLKHRPLMNKEAIAAELRLCQELHQKNNGTCNWGECKTCGVIPLLHKLHTGIVLEAPEEIQQRKNEVFQTNSAPPSQS